jgi:hypothetical protein
MKSCFSFPWRADEYLKGHIMKKVIDTRKRRKAGRTLKNHKGKGTIDPFSKKEKAKITEHPFFGMKKGDQAEGLEIVDDLRRGRFDAI